MDIITPDDKKNFDDLYIVFSKMDCDLLRVLNDQNQSLTGILNTLNLSMFLFFLSFSYFTIIDVLLTL